MQFKDIIYKVKDDYAHVTINRPKVLNAFTPVTLQELKTASGLFSLIRLFEFL
jgi:1,4-dihydroxy-2-naphthoyl-CoA synthase